MVSDVKTATIKAKAKELGADLVGIANAGTLNEFPPDPKWPQTPQRISPFTKSVVVIAKRIPAGAFRARTSLPVQYLDNLVLREIDKCAYRVAEWLQRQGFPSFISTSQETHWDYKGASYGQLSTRHLGIEAGLGTMGLEVNILTPEFGPRIYLTGVLTEARIDADQPITEQVCIGESCSRCLYSCPPDAVRHFGIDKRACTTEAQEYGYTTIQNFIRGFVHQDREKKRELLSDKEVFGFWQGLVRVVGSFGDCPRCLAVCPVGNDYHAHLAEVQKQIPEKTPEKVAKARTFKDVRKTGGHVDGLDDWNIRWVGPEGYKGMVARQLQEYKRVQAELAEVSDLNITEQNQKIPDLTALPAVRVALTAGQIKQRARELGIDLIGIADGAVLNANPPPGAPKRPYEISPLDSGRVIVLAKRYMSGTSRIADWNERHKHYNDEITLDLLEGAALQLAFWLEDRGYPASVIEPPNGNPLNINESGKQQTSHISLTHAAVDAGLGTLGLNLQLLTPEFGPRVILSGILCSVDCEPDVLKTEALCQGPDCGRCLNACPGDVVQHWGRDWAGCDRLRSPHGFAQTVGHFENIIKASEPDDILALVKSKETFHIWMSILRGAGVTTGCRRCQDVCPVGEDYDALHRDALDNIPEENPDKKTRISQMIEVEKTGVMTEQYLANKHWIGNRE